MSDPMYLAKSEDGYPALLPQMANRHGLITGATDLIGELAAAHLGGHGDFLGNLGEGGTALLVLATFTVLDIGPLGMTSHAVFPECK